MDMKKFISGSIAGGVAFFILGYLIYGMAFAGFFEVNVGTAMGVSKETPDFLWLGLGNLAWGVTYTYIFLKWARISTFAGGMKAGAILTFLLALSFDLTLFGTTNIANLTATLVDPFLAAVMGALGSGVIGAVLGMGGSSE